MGEGDFPSGPVVGALPSKAGGVGLFPGQGAKFPYALWPKKMKHKTETILTNPIKTLKKWPTSKNEIFATFLKILSTTNEIYFKILNFEKTFKGCDQNKCELKF